MTARIEHANLTVPDIDAAIRFLKAVEPDYEIMADRRSPDGVRWVHLGVNGTYLAIEEPHDRTAASELNPRYRNWGFNHLGLVVDDIAVAKERLEAAGFYEGHVPEINEFRIRRYFYDSAGLEWELVEYLTADPARRYGYT